MHVSLDCNRALVTKNNSVGEIPFMWLRWWLAKENKIQVLFRSAEHPSSSRGAPLCLCAVTGGYYSFKYKLLNELGSKMKLQGLTKLRGETC